MSRLAGSKLRLWRIEKKLTQAQAGKRFGATRMTWRRWESDEMRPGDDAMAALCSAVRGLQPNDFYELGYRADLQEDAA